MKRYTEAEVQERVAAAVAEAIAPLQVRIAQLQEQLARSKKNSSNSSKPPSSDIVKPPKTTPSRRGGKRTRGGQKGHTRHERTPFAEEELTRTKLFELKLDPTEWEPLEQWERVQQIELKTDPLDLVEYRARLYRNRKTGEIRHANLPADVLAAGLLGPRLTAFVAYLKGGCHTSYSTIATLFADVFRVPVSRGLLAKVVTGKVSAALQPSYEELLAALPQQTYLGIDETGHKDEGAHLWSWCFRAPFFTLFHIAPSRGSDVLMDLLGSTFNGIISCDYFSAYRKFMKDSSAVMQFCLAHLIRDVKFLAEATDKVTRNWADKTLGDFRKLFHIIHRRDTLNPRRFARQLAASRDQLIRRFLNSPARSGVRALRERFRLHPKEFFTFVTTPGIQPTNNFTEQAIRYLTIDRRITQGTRGEKGQRWCERIWTTISSCISQGRSVFDFLCSAVHAHFHQQPAPSLLPSGP